ncbi:MAG: type II toxin-antitoxin system HicA family toxin [Planctomycetia bacterium]|nr:type II toxin-antitoxin system HicA family toxin [Planctomycetia bacterium]
MPPLPVISGSQAVKVFQRDGWRIDRQRGSHVVLPLQSIRTRSIEWSRSQWTNRSWSSVISTSAA